MCLWYLDIGFLLFKPFIWTVLLSLGSQSTVTYSELPLTNLSKYILDLDAVAQWPILSLDLGHVLDFLNTQLKPSSNVWIISSLSSNKSSTLPPAFSDSCHSLAITKASSQVLFCKNPCPSSACTWVAGSSNQDSMYWYLPTKSFASPKDNSFKLILGLFFLRIKDIISLKSPSNVL